MQYDSPAAETVAAVEGPWHDSSSDRRSAASKARISPDIDVCLRALAHRLIDEADRVREQIYGEHGAEIDRKRRNTFRLSDYDPAAVAWAKFEYETRVLRSELFPEPLQDGPGWNMLLDLFVNAAHGRRISVTSACTASLVPASTGLRYVAHLERLGFVRKVAHPLDRRRQDLILTDHANIQLRRYFDRATNSCPVREMPTFTNK